jgi:hypothetical protein
VPNPSDAEHEQQREVAALLPDAATLERLMRYESHAERGIRRALETLARVRGVTVASIRATMTRPADGDAALELRGERTTWAGH